MRRANPEAIVSAVCSETGVERDELRSNRRTARIVRAREACAVALREIRSLSYPEIAKLIGVRSHGSVIRMEQRMRDRLEAEELSAMIGRVRVQTMGKPFELPPPRYQGGGAL